MLYKLESLRGIAACVVVLAHTPFRVFNKEFYQIDLAVDFFFVLSGFIMALAYQDRVSQGLSLKSFVILRLGRIYPLHFFTLLALLIFITVEVYMGLELAFSPSNNISTFISNIFLVHSMGIHDYLCWNFPSWSISTELFTYILFYFLLIGIDKKHQLILPGLIALFCFASLLSFSDSDTIAYTYNYGFIRCCGGFYLGVFIYRFKKKCTFLLKKHLSYFEALSFCPLVFLMVYSLGISKYYDLVYIVFFALIVFVFSEKQDGIIGNLIKADLFRLLGKYSYSIYLTHILIISFFELIVIHILKIDISSAIGVTGLIINLLVYLSIILTSHFCYNYIEEPFRQKTKRYVFSCKK